MSKIDDMKRVLILLTSVVIVLSCAGRGGVSASQSQEYGQEQTDMHNAENSLDCIGIYKGIFPAADCPGIEVSLELRDDNTFYMRWSYIDRNTVIDESGKYGTDGNILMLYADGQNNQPTYYRMGENRLEMLDSEKQPAEGPTADCYILIKTK